MWRRVPSGFRIVRPAFNPTLTNSINLIDKTPSVHGFVTIFTQRSAQAGSHSRSLSSAAAQGLAACSLAKAFAAMLCFSFFAVFAKSRTCLEELDEQGELNGPSFFEQVSFHLSAGHSTQ